MGDQALMQLAAEQGDDVGAGVVAEEMEGHEDLDSAAAAAAGAEHVLFKPGPVLDRINAGGLRQCGRAAPCRSLGWVLASPPGAGLGANELRWSPVEVERQSHSLSPTVQSNNAWGGNRSDLACRVLAGCLEQLSFEWPSEGGYKAGEGCSVSGGGGDGGGDGNGGAGGLPRISAKPRMRCSLGSGPRLHRLSK
jgi:hypothetical protein